MRVHRRMTEAGYFLNAMDPGGDTGLSLFHVQPDGFRLLEYATVTWRPRQGSNPTSTLVAWRLEYPGDHVLVYEGFHVRNTQNAAATDTTPLEVIGALEQVMYDRGGMYAEIVSQEPVAAKGQVTDEQLEKLNLHLGHKHAQRHVRDANRHAVTYLAKCRYLPVCEVAYPRRPVRTRSALPG